jgi:hypothetical protein
MSLEAKKEQRALEQEIVDRMSMSQSEVDNEMVNKT